MSVYLDASFLVALFTNDPFSERADAFLATQRPVVITSDFATAEFASAVSRRVRTKEVKPAEARAAFADFDNWRALATERVEILTHDVVAAERHLRRLDTSLRAPDAINISIAQRIGSALATFDERMAAAAVKLGVGIEMI